MKEVSWSKVVGQILEEGTRILGEIEKEMVKQAEQAKAEPAKTHSAPEAKAPAPAPASNSLQAYTASNLIFQGYEVKEDIQPNLIHVLKNGNPVAYVVFAPGNIAYIEPAVSNSQVKVLEAKKLVENLKGELLSALRANVSDEIIMKTALELTDAYVGETVAKEDADAFTQLVQIVTSLLAETNGVH